MSSATECAVCGEGFASRNRLFKHLKESGHGASKEGGDDGTGGSRRDDGDDDGGEPSDVGPRLSKGNDAYYDYYLRQRICGGDDDKNERAWNDAYRRMRTPLPVAYRVHESSPINEFSSWLLEMVEKKYAGGSAHDDDDEVGNAGEEASGPSGAFQKLSFGKEDGDTLPKLQMTITPSFHRRNKSNRSNEKDGTNSYSPIMHALQELGAIHRQELVSAIPPLALWAIGSKGEEGDDGSTIVADLCAAPGSKSLQLLDMLYTSAKDGSIPSGLLVVNDADRNRIVTLCQRSRHVPRAPMLAINMDARYFPGMRRRSNRSSTQNGGTDAIVGEKTGYKQKYDKVLIDVPCTGDGTTRKNRKVWNEWSISHAMSLHKLQRKILRRGMELLRPGGIAVYSTCSLNPLENEATLASVINEVGGVAAMEIVTLPEWLVQKCGASSGLTTWRVPDPKFGKNGVSEMYESFHDVPVKQRGGEVGGKKGGPIERSMFPPEKSSDVCSQLKYCGRFLPTSPGMDSGGFFVACIRRLHVGDLGVNIQASQSVPTESNRVIPQLEKPSEAATEEVGQSEASNTEYHVPSSKNGQVLREGDWICAKCKEINFARRGGSRCFGCKAKRPRPVQKDKEFKAQRPLLSQNDSLVESFLEYFGVPLGQECPLPVQNIRVISRAKELTLIIVSDAVSKLSISDTWSPVREVGISLAAVTRATDGESGKSPEFRLFDEGLTILTPCATRRHFNLPPDAFLNALLQSVGLLLQTSSGGEVERVKATLDNQLLMEIANGEKKMAWYEALEECMTPMWSQCKSSPGYFIVSCKCEIPTEGHGQFSFLGSTTAGSVEVKTSLRIAVAMLVVLKEYTQLVRCTKEKKRKRA